MRCVVCGSESVERGQYCPRCGSIIAEPVRLDDPRLVSAEDDLRKAIGFRQSTDVMIEPLWAIVPLILSIVGAVAGIAIYLARFPSFNDSSGWTAGEAISSMRDFFLMLFLTSLASATVLASITYKLVKRRKDHSSREQGVRMALVKLVRAAAWSRERSDSVFPELRIMEQDLGLQKRRDPLAWSLAIALGGVTMIGILPLFFVSDLEDQIGIIFLSFGLSALVGLVAFILMYYMFYWFGKDIKEHDTRWNIFSYNARNAMSKLGFPSPTTSRYGQSQLPERPFVLYFVVTLFFSPFVYYWWYTLIKDPNEHFRAQWRFEDDLLATISDKRYQSSPFTSTASTR